MHTARTRPPGRPSDVVEQGCSPDGGLLAVLTMDGARLHPADEPVSTAKTIRLSTRIDGKELRRTGGADRHDVSSVHQRIADLTVTSADALPKVVCRHRQGLARLQWACPGNDCRLSGRRPWPSASIRCRRYRPTQERVEKRRSCTPFRVVGFRLLPAISQFSFPAGRKDRIHDQPGSLQSKLPHGRTGRRPIGTRFPARTA